MIFEHLKQKDGDPSDDDDEWSRGWDEQDFKDVQKTFVERICPKNPDFANFDVDKHVENLYAFFDSDQKQMMQFMNIAKYSTKVQLAKACTREELGAIFEYTDNSVGINGFLRGTKLDEYFYPKEFQKKQADLIGMAFGEKGQELKKDMVLYRCVNDEVANMFIKDGFSDKALISTTPTPKLARMFGNNLIVLLTPKGHKALGVDGNSEYKKESEILLSPNTKGKVFSVREVSLTKKEDIHGFDIHRVIYVKVEE